jgi:hypothetical protein
MQRDVIGVEQGMSQNNNKKNERTNERVCRLLIRTSGSETWEEAVNPTAPCLCAAGHLSSLLDFASTALRALGKLVPGRKRKKNTNRHDTFSSAPSYVAWAS